jgi:hypothetical protein
MCLNSTGTLVLHLWHFGLCVVMKAKQTLSDDMQLLFVAQTAC